MEIAVAQLLGKIEGQEDLASALIQHLPGENQRVAGEVLWRLLNHPNAEVRGIAYRFVRFLEDDLSLRRGASPLVNYVSEKQDSRDWELLIEKNLKGEIQADWQRIAEERLITSVVKRLLDILISFIVIFISAPLFVLLIVLLRLESRYDAPTLFITRRLGQGGKPFPYFRLNAMSIDPDSGSKYLGTIGLLLLSTGLDRLPTFINVLRGEMSLVGPHPLYLSQLDR